MLTSTGVPLKVADVPDPPPAAAEAVPPAADELLLLPPLLHADAAPAMRQAATTAVPHVLNVTFPPLDDE
jgi:hypothetical protein